MTPGMPPRRNAGASDTPARPASSPADSRSVDSTPPSPPNVPRRNSGAMMAISFEWPVPTRRPSRALVVPVLPDEDEGATSSEQAGGESGVSSATPTHVTPIVDATERRAPAVIAAVTRELAVAEPAVPGDEIC